MMWDNILKIKPIGQKTLRELVHDEFKRQLGSNLPRRIFYYERKATEALIDKIKQQSMKENPGTRRSILIPPNATLSSIRTYPTLSKIFKLIPEMLEKIVTDYINTEEFKSSSRLPNRAIDPLTEDRLKVGNLEIDEETREALSETIEPSERAMGMLSQSAKDSGFRVYPISETSENKYGQRLGNKAYEMIGEVDGIVFSIGFDSSRDSSGDTYFNVKGKSTLKVCIKQGTTGRQPIADRIATFALGSRVGAIQYNDSVHKIPALVYATLCAGGGISEKGIVFTPFGGPNIRAGNNFQAFCRSIFSAIAGTRSTGNGIAQLLVDLYLQNNTDNISGREVELLGLIQMYLSGTRQNLPRVTGEELRPLLLKIYRSGRNF